MVAADKVTDRVTLRCDLRYVPHGVAAVFVGWPSAKMTITADELFFDTGPLLVFARAKWSVRRECITKIEPTQHYGVRFYATGFESPWTVARGLFPRRFLRRLEACGIHPTGPVVRATWLKI